MLSVLRYAIKATTVFSNVNDEKCNFIFFSILALEDRLTPSSCKAALDYGQQTLRSGKEIFCDGKWTVSFFKLENFETKFIIITKDGSMVQYVSTVRYASIFAEKYVTLVRYAFFAMARVRYVGALFEFAD